MFFRLPRFIRRWIRRRMHPMAEDKAWTIRERLAVAYMFFAWNAGGLVIYQLYKGNVHWPITEGLITEEESQLDRPAYSFAHILNIPKAKVYRLSVRGGLQEMAPIDLLAEKAIAESKAKAEAEQQLKTDSELLSDS